MIINIEELRKQQSMDEEFDLGEAIRNDEVDLIFGGTEELINELYTLEDGKMAMLIRNKVESSIKHNFTMKFIPNDRFRRVDPNFKHDGHYGLPISFTKDNKEWYVNLGKSKMSEAKKIQASLTKKEKLFIDAVVNDIGDDIIDYWNVKNPDTDKGKKELNDIIERIENKYEK